MSATKRNQLFAGICFVLALVTLAVYWPMMHHGFVNYDDPEYITGNPQVTAGLTWPGIVWAFQGHSANWHPLTWISHMVDCNLFALNPAGHHLMNLLFHIANTLLLFFLLNGMTGALWRSAFVAALFAWHPLHVESVAWASERKDVLSTFFWLLTLLAYACFVQRSEGRSQKPETCGLSSPTSVFRPLTSGFYWLALFLFACGLMSKPMVVTLPFVLLLLDFWPLNRFAVKPAVSLVLEKLPFFVLSVTSSVITCFAQKDAMWSSVSLPLHFRMVNALMSYARYISKTFWPTDLALIYPYPHHWPAGLVTGAVLLLAAWSALFILRAKRNPYLMIGWFWFLGTLVPAIGLVQTGVQSMADRYTYIPGIGLFIVAVWGLNDLADLWPKGRKYLPLAGGIALAGCLMVTSIQINYWQDSIKLFSHTIDVTRDNYAAYDCLGDTLEKLGRKDEAFALYAETVRIEPDFPAGQFNLGMMLLEKGSPDEAFKHLNIAMKLMPRDPVIQFDLGMFLLQHGKPEEAIARFTAALKEKPDFTEARSQLDQILNKTNAPPSPANRSTH